VSLGDEGLTQCAGKCDEAGDCVAYSTTDNGSCSMFKALNVSSREGCTALSVARLGC
jgi:hypothetical protein